MKKDDLKEQLLTWYPGQDEESLREEAVARITDLETRLAAAEAGLDALAMGIAIEMEVHASLGTTTKAKADAILAALAAYEARRKG